MLVFLLTSRPAVESSTHLRLCQLCVLIEGQWLYLVTNEPSLLCCTKHVQLLPPTVKLVNKVVPSVHFMLTSCSVLELSGTPPTQCCFPCWRTVAGPLLLLLLILSCQCWVLAQCCALVWISCQTGVALYWRCTSRGNECVFSSVAQLKHGYRS